MNRFFQRCPEGHSLPILRPPLPLDSLACTHCGEEARGDGIPAKSLNRCFYRFSFREGGITAPVRSLAA
jgi:hypothetical protein